MAGMKLLVDVGNSRIKWALGTAAGFVATGELRQDGANEIRAVLGAGQVPDEIRVANVAGAAAGARLAASLREQFGVAAVFARSAAAGAGVRSGYTDPSQLGVDRWLGICAAYARYGAPACVVDAGTATTIDIVNGAGDHQGGLILPGVALMESALLAGTSDLARLSAGADLPRARGPGNASPVVLGRDTASAIRGGALQATACLVGSCLRTLGPHPLTGLLVLTGGAGPLLGAEVLRGAGPAAGGAAPPVRLEHRPHLVLEGLALDPPCFEAPK